jgi:hypothetical protein
VKATKTSLQVQHLQGRQGFQEAQFSGLINGRDAIAAFAESFVRLCPKWQSANWRQHFKSDLQEGYETRGGSFQAGRLAPH